MALKTQESESLETLRHTSSHILAQAVLELFPGTKLSIGPSTDDGFYYDFDREEPFGIGDLEKIEERMKEIVKRDLPIERSEMGKEEAIEFFRKNGQPYKVELLEEIEDAVVSCYAQGDFTDLCRGPHLPSTGKARVFKLLSVAGSYWRGDEKRKMLQRIYGTSFFSKEDLKEHLKRLEEAKKRDHRKIGKALDLFSINDEIGPGLINWHPKGALIRHIIEDFWKTEHFSNGYQLIQTPHMAKVHLWETSGHMDFYKDNIFSPMEVEGQAYIVKPMNCPFHIQIYKTRQRSYRDLPFRWAELGTVYRYERSGVMHGLLRVRGFTQDDAHIFCRPDQLAGEISTVLNFTVKMLRAFGFSEYDIYLSTKPEKFVGSEENWKAATDSLKGALEQAGLAYQVDPGEGVFYGPKIDVKIKDCLGRSWQCSTIQVDFNLPERFDVNFVGSDGASHRAIMIHRALLGSLERFFGCLIEHYAGAFPVWLSPVQAILLPITDAQNGYALEAAGKMRERGLRVEVDSRNEKVGFKIREAQMQKIPYMLVVGEKEEKDGTVSVRERGGENTGPIDKEEFIEKTLEKIRARRDN